MKKEEGNKVKPLPENLPWALRPGCEIQAVLCKRWASSDCRHLRAAEKLQAPSHGFRRESGWAAAGTREGECLQVGRKASQIEKQPDSAGGLQHSL